MSALIGGTKMKTVLLQMSCAIALAVAAPAEAAVLSFDLNGFESPFDGTRVAGQFVFDTVSAVFSGIGFTTSLDEYMANSGTFQDGTGFGLPSDLFAFRTAVTTFFFGVDDLNQRIAGLAVGDTLTFGDLFAFESEAVTPDFQIDLSGGSNTFFGDVTVTVLADPVAAVPLPASLPLLLAGLGGLGLAAARRSKAA
jgi:hypothetical protein